MPFLKFCTEYNMYISLGINAAHLFTFPNEKLHYLMYICVYIDIYPYYLKISTASFSLCDVRILSVYMFVNIN